MLLLECHQDARGDQCDSCTRTLDAIDLIKPRCLIDKKHNITSKTSAHMYVKLDAIQPKTEAWIKNSAKEGKWSPNSVINADGELVDARLKSGLRPSPVTRDLQWGVPVPIEGEDEDGMKGKVLCELDLCCSICTMLTIALCRCLGAFVVMAPSYHCINDAYVVQYDAPIGYPSITANYTPEWKQWWFNQKNVRLYQFMGKDNVYFHTVFFPSIILGDGRDWTTLHHLSTTGTFLGAPHLPCSSHAM